MGYSFTAPEPGEEVVIAGVAGRFPDSDNVKAFQENLFNKVDLISNDSRRWQLDHPEIPQRTGKVNNVNKFDALFFGVHFKQAHTMDPMCRMLLEHTYEAVIDAGINPRQLRGTKTGVFIGACFSESEKTWFYEKLQVNGFGITGCSRAMLANRISYWLGVHGPSYTLDSACSSSLFALENAYRAIRQGLCDSAIVGGSNLCLHPYVSLQFSRLGVLSPDGRCKSFDADADGYARSETIAVIFLQKAKDAKRIYATIVHGKANCDGYKEQGITFPSSVMQGALLKEFYDECKFPAKNLAYMEAHGTGTKVGDPEEINAIEQVFCKNRTTPLKIGSIKSNMGHSEPASGLCSVTKMIIAMETGYIPPNLNFKRPREGVKALEDGRIRVVTEPTPWEGGHVGINSFGFGGANVHILLKSHAKEKINKGIPADGLPRLVIASGRTEEAVAALLNDVNSRPADVEHVKLFHDIHAEEIPGHLYRGYTIAKAEVSDKSIREIQSYSGAKRPIWFVFSGMGSQWPGMGQALMKFPVFAKAIQKCDAVLKPRGVDIVDIITNRDKKMFDNILNSFVGIAAVQIGLVDLLTSVGIVPDNIIGHSVGELGCAYADGCFTAEQMILSAYSRGLASIETKTIYGSMAAVGMGYEDLKGMCPPDIDIACHNGPGSSTISGPSASMKEFVAKLTANKIFAREVPCSNIPYHSRYIAAAGPKLLAYLRQVIPTPKARSQKWVSTSVPRAEWSTSTARLSSAEYHTNNLLSPVLFEETSVMIPKDAITIEIAPHGLLQAILKRSLHQNVINVALTQRDHEDNAVLLLQGLGKLYNAGLQPQLANLYPPVQYPVSRGTPMISPHIKWEHSEDWYVTCYKMQEKITSGERIVELALSDEDFEFMGGHVIDGRNLIPATGYLTLVWETLGMMRGELYTEVSVVFEDVKFLRATNIPKDSAVNLTIMLQKGTGRFEVVESGAAVVTGMIRAAENIAQETLNTSVLTKHDDDEEEDEPLTSRDIYKEFKLRGYNYNGLFRGLKSVSLSGRKGKIAWQRNWVAFMDNMLQMQIIGLKFRSLVVPTGIQKLVIDTKKHIQHIRTMTDDNKHFPVRVYKDLDILVSGGVEIRGLKANVISRRKPMGEPVLEEYKFVAHRDRATVSLAEALRLSTHVALENDQIIKVKTVELLDKENVTAEDLASPHLTEILADLPLIQADVILATPPNRFEDNALPKNMTVIEPKKMPVDKSALIAVGYELLSKKKVNTLEQFTTALRDGGFIVSREPIAYNPDRSYLETHGLDVLLEKQTAKDLIVLLRRKRKLPKTTTVVRVNNKEFAWLEEVKGIMKEVAERGGESNIRLLVIGEKDFESGVLGFVNCLRKEPGGEIIRGVLIQDDSAPAFSLDNPLYANQLQMDLAINVLRPKTCWGSYRHLALPPVTERPTHHVILRQGIRGDLSSVHWYQGSITPDMKHEDIIHVLYSSINFRDIMLLTAKLTAEVYKVASKIPAKEDTLFGFEYCGIDSRGRRVMGMSPCECFSNLIIADRKLCWFVPDEWTLEEAATIPTVYSTCYSALYECGKMKKGDKVLIHAGSGGVGQAAINLALHEGCEVFTTVGTPEKRKFIRETFPSIPDDHIGNSRDTSFEQLIHDRTNGRGVDIVLNSLADEKLLASVRCLAPCGRFLEIGKADLTANNALGMYVFLKEVSFHGVMLDNIFVAPDERRLWLHTMVKKGLDSGAIKPLVRTCFSRNELESAFRYIATGKHIGKVMVKIHHDNEPLDTPIMARPAYHCKPNKSYVILGGLGGFGLELTDWLVHRGAQNVVLTSRNGIKNGYQRSRIALWKSYDVNVLIISGQDASVPKECEFILKAANDMAPIDAIFNLAVVLKDGICQNQTQEMFEDSFRAKAWTTKTLDQLSRKMCPQLRHFVVFSSVSCGRGNAGQTNYGMSNSVMERIVEKRVADGLPGLAIQWGAIGDVGLVADMQENDKELVIGGTLQQKITSCLQELDAFLIQDRPIVCSMVVAEKRAGAYGVTNVVDMVVNIMGIKDLKTVSLHTSLAELGMDSIMAVEIKQSLEREFEVFLTAQDIRTLNFAKLMEMAAKEEEEEKKRGVVPSDTIDTVNGIKLLLRNVGEEVITTEICYKLPTKGGNRDEVFLIPGIEGSGAVFDVLAPTLNCFATCLQFSTNKINHNSIEDMAKSLLPYILTKRKENRDFIIVGYSFGSLISIELVRLLEAQGFTGRLILIDGAPLMMKAMKDLYMPSNTDDELQCNVLLTLMDVVAPQISAELAEKFEKCSTWDERMDVFIKHFPSEFLKMSYETQKEAYTLLYKRFLAVENYSQNLPRIKSSILLLKPSIQSFRSQDEDYELKKITEGKVDVHFVEGNHVTMLSDPRVGAAINGESLEDARSFKASIMEEGKHLTPLQSTQPSRS